MLYCTERLVVWTQYFTEIPMARIVTRSLQRRFCSQTGSTFFFRFLWLFYVILSTSCSSMEQFFSLSALVFSAGLLDICGVLVYVCVCFDGPQHSSFGKNAKQPDKKNDINTLH